MKLMMGKVCHYSGSSNDIAMKKLFTKGPWTDVEDKLLTAYVNQHGHGNWNDVEKHSGLTRSGKSCRHRWVNHLRPELKKSTLTEKEKQRVIELHAIHGNKWAQMASQLPGRTDNDIKNFWHTRLKRLQRHGLPVYPGEVQEQAMNATSKSGLNTYLLDAHRSQNSLDADNVEKPYLPLNQCSSYYDSMFANVPTTGCFPFSVGYAMEEQNPALWNNPFVESSPEQVADNHLLGNATYSSLHGPLIHGIENLELPSFQCFNSHEEPNSFGAQQSNQMSALMSENTLVLSPLTEQTPSDFPSSLYDLESPLFSLLGHTELTPTSVNTTDLGCFGSTPSNERRTSYDDDVIKTTSR